MGLVVLVDVLSFYSDIFIFGVVFFFVFEYFLGNVGIECFDLFFLVVFIYYFLCGCYFYGIKFVYCCMLVE